MLLSHELTHRSATFVTDMPPEQFGEKKPNFNLLLFRMGDCFRPMKPQATRLRDFTQLITCGIMPENLNCSSLVDGEAVGGASPASGSLRSRFRELRTLCLCVQRLQECDNLPPLLFRQLRPDRHAPADNSIGQYPKQSAGRGLLH